MELTKHSIERAKSRLNLNERSISRLAEKALETGKKHSECKGKLRKYIDKIYLEYKTANNIRIYGHIIFLFVGEKLITLYQIPNDLKKWLKL